MRSSPGTLCSHSVLESCAADVAGLGELEVGCGSSAGRDVDRLRTDQDCSRPPGWRWCNGRREAIGREAEAALVVAHHRGGDGAAVALGADQNAFHRAFLGRDDLAGERRRLCTCGRRHEREPRQRAHEACRGKQVVAAHDRLPQLACLLSDVPDARISGPIPTAPEPGPRQFIGERAGGRRRSPARRGACRRRETSRYRRPRGRPGRLPQSVACAHRRSDWQGLLERRLHAGEGGVEDRADAVDGGHDHQGDPGRDQAVLDRRRARLSSTNAHTRRMVCSRGALTPRSIGLCLAGVRVP